MYQMAGSRAEVRKGDAEFSLGDYESEIPNRQPREDGRLDLESEEKEEGRGQNQGWR